MDLRCDLLGAQLPNREEFQYAILHVLESVVILLKNLGRARQVEVIVGAIVPRQLGNPLEIRADHLRFHGLATRTFEPANLALDFRARFLRQVEVGELLAQLRHFLRLIVVAELLLNRLELFAQKHLALTLAQLLLDLRLDILLRLHESDLALHVHQHPAQPILHRQRLEQSLLLRHRQLDVAGHKVRETPGVVDRVEHLVHDFFG